MENKRLTQRFLGSNAPFTEFATDSEIINKLADLEDKIENGELVERKQGEWISVEDRLPERNGRYLTHCLIEGQSLVCILHYNKIGGFNESTVTHWQSLPQPPKMKGE